MSLYKPGQSSTPKPVGVTEFEILKASHKFLRDQDEKASSWDEQLAAKYYSSLYREFALCDLKHYKSGNFSLRWRTEEEVLSGSGETTCGNTRCEHHFAVRQRFDDEPIPTIPLTTLELPFAYVEQEESKTALVKVVLCGKCLKKLMWKRTKEKEKELVGENLEVKERSVGKEEKDDLELDGKGKEKARESKRRSEVTQEESRRKRRRSGSRSPRRTKHYEHGRREHDRK